MGIRRTFQLLLREVVKLGVKSEGPFGDGLVRGIVVLLQVRVCQRGLDREPLVRVEGQQVIKQSERCTFAASTAIGPGKEGSKTMVLDDHAGEASK